MQALLDTLAETDIEDGEDLAAWAGELSDAELAELEALEEQPGRDYPDHMAPGGGTFSQWMDALSSERFGTETAMANASGDYLGWLDDAARIDRSLQTANDRERTRQIRDEWEKIRRSGTRHRRPLAEEKIAAAAVRLSNGTHLKASPTWPVTSGVARGPFRGSMPAVPCRVPPSQAPLPVT